MSYILDALKKLEHEKSRKSRGTGMINISGALFENEQPRLSGPSGWKILLFVLVAMLVTFGATWLLLRPVKTPENPAPRHAAPASPAPPARIATVPAPPAPPLVPVQPISAIAPPVAEKVPTAVRRSFAAPKPQSVAVQAATAGEDAASRLTMLELRKRMKERKGPSLSADQFMPAPADITLSGIAWQEERRARRAVVNGFLMQEGGFVSGARISEIYQDRVRFSLSGKIFEVPLVSSGVSTTSR